MSVLHICRNLPESRVFGELFEALRDAGLEQQVFAPVARESELSAQKPEGVPAECVYTLRPADALLFFRKARRTVPEIERRIDLSGVRLLHAHTLFTDGSIAMKLSERTGLPYVVTLRYSDIEAIWRYEPHLRPLGRRVLRGARRAVFLGEGVRERVLRDWFDGAERERLRERSAVIPNGLSPAWLDGAPRERLGDAVRVGFAGVMTRRKRPLDALAAVHAASDRGGRRYVLRAAGDGPLLPRLQSAMLPGDRALGRLQGMEEMKRFYAGCDMLLVPSKAETFGMVYLEAMSQGVPVIYTRGQGFDGQFPEGEIGYAAACGDVREQADRLIQLADGYAMRSERCVRRAAEYAWPVIAQRWLTLYAAAQSEA